MEASIRLEIISPEKKILSRKVYEVTLPGVVGSFQVLKNHAPLITSLEKGEIRFMLDDSSVHAVPIEGGFVEVIDNKVIAIVEV